MALIVIRVQAQLSLEIICSVTGNSHIYLHHGTITKYKVILIYVFHFFISSFSLQYFFFFFGGGRQYFMLKPNKNPSLSAI